MISFKWYKFRILFIAILIGTTFSIFYLQDDPAFKSYVEDKISQYFSNSFACNFRARLSKISLFTGELVLEDLHAIPADIGLSNSEQELSQFTWSWQAKKAVSKISFFSFFWNAKIDLDISLDNLNLVSQIDQSKNLAIVPHLKLLLDISPVDLPIVLRSFHVNHGDLNLYNKEQETIFTSEFWLNCATLSNSFKTSLNLNNGKLTLGNIEKLNKLSGDITHSINSNTYPDNNNFDNFDLAVKLKFDINSFNKNFKTCFVDGNLINNTGKFELNSADKELDINLQYKASDSKKLELDGNFNLNYIFSILGINLSDKELLSSDNKTGTCKFKGEIDFNDSDILLSGDLNIDKIKSGPISLENIHMSILKDELGLKSEISVDNFYGSKLNGNLLWDSLNNIGSCTLENNLQADFGAFWRILPGDFKLVSNFSGINNFDGVFKLKISHPRIEQTYDINSRFSGVSGLINLFGNFNSSDFELKLKSEDKISLESFKIKSPDKKTVLDMGSDKLLGSSFNLTVDYDLIKNLLTHFKIEDFTGTGTLNINGEFYSGGLKANLLMSDANIKLARTNNLIKKLYCDLDFNFFEKNIKISQLNLGFAKGVITSSQSVLRFTDFANINFAHVPLKIEDFMLSFQRDFFAIVSGSVLLQYLSPDKPKITGTIILDKSYLRDNILSSELINSLKTATVSPLTSYKTDSDININLLTKTSLKIKTSFLDATSKLNLNFSGTIFNPIISGAIEVVGGNFAFPYKPLFITYGKIDLLPNQLSDATIELKAQQRIKKYDIFMNITGNLSDPQIEFDSTPQLSKEQIISLLWAGSEAGSLYMIMPHVVMQNVQKLIFGQEDNVSKAQRYFKNIFKPFEKVRIIPDFSDQTGRGGLRGSIEIDVNDRLRGLIQKNFSLSEDVKLEVDYDLSDDSSIRAIRDERGDLGAELEMRWKF